MFTEALMLAVSDLADDVWDIRFAALLTLQDQSMMGRGAVGFDVEDIGWGTTPQACSRSKDFVLRAVARSSVSRVGGGAMADGDLM
ncbi:MULTISPECIES: hypothetical protein [unclassified Streptomyces]|uniref:hypothetical protein n=1 Tax=unclassified Streptomyces TaxID=2593676 RepID=UPI00381B0EFE